MSLRFSAIASAINSALGHLPVRDRRRTPDRRVQPRQGLVQLLYESEGVSPDRRHRER